MRQKLQKRIQALQKHVLSKRTASLPLSLKSNKTNHISSLSTSFSFINQNVSNLISESKKSPNDFQEIDMKIRANSLDSRNSNIIGKKYFDLEHYKARVCTQNLYGLKEKLNLPKLTPSLIKNINLSPQKKRLFFEQSDQRIKRRAYKQVEEIYQTEEKKVEEKYKQISRIKSRISVLDKIYLDKQKLNKKYAQLNKS